MVQQMKKPYLDKNYYKMKDILHHAHMRNSKPKMRKPEPNAKNIIYERHAKSLQRSEEKNPEASGHIDWKYRRNPIFGMQYT